MKDFKQRIITNVLTVLVEKLNSLNLMMADLNEASKNETKSTVGDKHETSKAMMHLEQEKLGSQIKEIEFQIKEYNAINFNSLATSIVLGSYIETNQGSFFIATALGKIVVDEKSIFVISNKSPLGLKLLGLKKNESSLFNNVTYIVNSIN